MAISESCGRGAIKASFRTPPAIGGGAGRVFFPEHHAYSGYHGHSLPRAFMSFGEF